MAGIIENVDKIKSVFGDIKTAIQNKGVVVEDNTPVSEYGGLVDNIASSGVFSEDWSYMFYENSRHDVINDNIVDSSYVKKFYRCAEDSAKLKIVKDMDTSSATNTSYMFSGCKNIEEFPSYFNLTSLDPTTNSAYQMFYHVGYSNDKLRSKNMFVDLPPVCNTQSLFFYSPFKSIHITSDTKCTNMLNMFRECFYLEEITGLNMSQSTNYTAAFSNCKSLVNLELVGTIAAKGTYSTTLKFEDSPLLSYESLMRILYALETVTSTKEDYAAKLVLGETNLAKLSDEEKAIAASKGWILS